jgi:hypothetical protein
LTYKYNSSDLTAKTITAETNRIILKGNGYDVYGGIYNNGTTIIDHLHTIYNGDYFILLDNGLYCLFAYIDMTEDGRDFIFERAFMTNNINEMLEEIAKPSLKEVAWSLDNYIVAGSGVIDDYFGTHAHGIALAKDNRERILFNYNLQMLTDSDRFVLSGYLWQQNKGTLKIALLNTEVNKIINNTIPESYIIVDPITDTQKLFNINASIMFDAYIDIRMNTILASEDLTNVKAIAIISDKKPPVGNKSEAYFVMARNVDGLTEAQKREDWYVTAIDADNFFNKQ